MTAAIKKIQKIFFGKIDLDHLYKKEYELLNNSVLELAKTTPRAMQNEISFFILKYCGIKIGEPVDFFKGFYVPTWSIILHLFRSKKIKINRDYKQAFMGQAMAMFMHSLDDHMNDKEIDISHSLLFLRSHVYMEYLNSCKSFGDEKLKPGKVIMEHLDRYYSAIAPVEDFKNLDQFLENFKGEISTWYVIPFLIAKKLGFKNQEIKDIINGFGEFGVAWRIIDDIQDIEVDIKGGHKSSVYFALPKKYQGFWISFSKRNEKAAKERCLFEISDYLETSDVIEKLKIEIVSRLKLAASYAEKLKLYGLADDYKALVLPIERSLSNVKNR